MITHQRMISRFIWRLLKFRPFLVSTALFGLLTFNLLPSPSSSNVPEAYEAPEGSLVSSLKTGENGMNRWYLRNVTLSRSLTFKATVPSFGMIWPHQKQRGDRIEAQLMFPSTNAQNGTKLIYSNIRGMQTRPPAGRKHFVMSKCPISDCMLTYDETKAKDADAILFRNRLSPSLQDGTLYRRPKNQIWIMYLLEPPHHFDDFSRIGAQINWTATYRHDSELVTPYEKFALYDSTVISKKQTMNHAALKRGKVKVAWFVSNCHTSNRRMEYVQELMKFIDVDIYGACGPHKCEKLPGHNCDSILRNYKFSLSFENSNCRWYITEKFWTALEANVVPIVMGAPRSDYEDVAPYKSFIHVDDFAGPQELAAYLHHLDRSDEAYNRYFQWKGTGELIDTRFYCRLCALLHSKIIPAKYYPDFQQWWAGAHVCAKTAPAVLQ